jgi:hypothetical protein
MTPVRIPLGLAAIAALIGFLAADAGASDDYEFVAKPTGIHSAARDQRY